MAYELKWNSKSPGHLVFLIDLSESMLINNKIKEVMDALAYNLNSIANDLEGISSIKEYLTITIIGYHSKIIKLMDNYSVSKLIEHLENTISKQKLLFNYDKGGEAEPMWQTYMSNALDAAREDIVQWLSLDNGGKRRPAPIVINITDGQPEENKKSLTQATNEALKAAQRLKDISTSDGNVLLYNFHLGTTNNRREIAFPSSLPATSGDEREDLRIKFMFESSSVLPASAIDLAKLILKVDANHQSRGMVSNVSNKNMLVQLIDIGCSSMGLSSTGLETPMPLK